MFADHASDAVHGYGPELAATMTGHKRQSLAANWMFHLPDGTTLPYTEPPVKSALPMTAVPTIEHPLEQRWPSFLDELESNASQAAREFVDYAYRTLTVRPPRVLRDLTSEERDDVIQEIIIHFIQDDCRVLKSYRNTGHPFTSWFLTVASNRAWDYFRKGTARAGQTISGDSAEGEEGILGLQATSTPSPEDVTAQRRALDAVRRLLGRLGRKCQILLRAAAEEYTPQEMLVLTGLNEKTNKQVSDDLRACRKRLLALLEAEGIVLEKLGF